VPVVRFHLVAGEYSTAQVKRLLVSSAQVYSETLQSPMERVRGFVQLYEPELCLVAGDIVGDGGRPAPFFEFIVLAGRPLEQRQSLLRAFTELVVEHLGAERRLVRGRAIEVSPEDWAIAGVPASVQRADEIRLRAEAAAT
jgi:phenylpyruvate tautomerase PptA (4-oxalocrotonate tautomerase family)